MEEVTQRNATLVEQAAASVDSLHRLVSSMAQTVSVFKLAQSALALPIRIVTPEAAKPAPFTARQQCRTTRAVEPPSAEGRRSKRW